MDDKVYIIAEIGNTHEGSLGLAKQFIKAASECGVDAVKFQTHIFEAESLPDAPNPPYFKDETRKEYFERTSFTLRQWIELRRYAEEELELDFLSSPFSLEAVDLLVAAGVDVFKIASGEVSNIPLLEKIARNSRRVLLSSGMSDWAEIDEAVETLQSNGCDDLVVLQCTSEYPCLPKNSGLNVIELLKERYRNVEVGYSDHTLGLAIPISAVAKGATVIEKHFTLSNKMYGSDAMNATEPNEFKMLVEEIRKAEVALITDIDKDMKVKELIEMKATFEKSIVAARDVSKFKKIVFDDLAFKKPGDGISARYYNRILGMKINKEVGKDYKFKWEDFV